MSRCELNLWPMKMNNALYSCLIDLKRASLTAILQEEF